MSRRRKQQGKTFQQRQTEQKLREQRRKQSLDATIEEQALSYTCSIETARDFAVACTQRLDDLEFDLTCTQIALDFWSDVPAQTAPLAEILRELATEHQRHAEVVGGLRDRLDDLMQNEGAHHHLGLPIEYYENQIRLRLFPETGEPSELDRSGLSGLLEP